MKPVKIHASNYDLENYDITRRGDTLDVNLTYPGQPGDPEEGRVRYVTFDQESVRSTQGIRIHFSLSRNEYVIEMATVTSWATDDKVMDPRWEEIACAPAHLEGPVRIHRDGLAILALGMTRELVEEWQAKMGDGEWTPDMDVESYHELLTACEPRIDAALRRAGSTTYAAQCLYLQDVGPYQEVYPSKDGREALAMFLRVIALYKGEGASA